MISTDYEALERELIEDLKWFAQNATLPEKYQVEPGAFLHLVARSWQRDGRGGGLSDVAVAERLATATGLSFSRNQFQTTFGPGKTTGYKQCVAKSAAKAFLDIAFECWRPQVRGVLGFLSLQGLDPTELKVAKHNAVEAMYRQGKVYCRDATAAVIRPWLDIKPILQMVVASEVETVTLEDLTEVVESIQRARLERVITPALIIEMFRQRKLGH